MENNQKIELLSKDLQSQDHKVRLQAIKELGESGDADALVLLVPYLDSDWVTHEAAAKALGQLRDPRAIPALLSVLRSSERQGGSAVTHALGRIGIPALPPLLEILSSTQDNIMRRAVTNAISHIDSPPIEELISLLSSNGPAAWSSIHALGRLKDRHAVQPLLDLLNSSEGQTQNYVIDALCNIGDPRAIDPLIRVLHDSDKYTQEHVIRALYFIGDERVLPELRIIAKEYQNKEGSDDLKYWLKQAIEKFEHQVKSRI